MFAYQDPTGTDFLASQSALEAYRESIDRFYRRSALAPSSAFTLLEAFEGVAATTVTVPWIAFPRLAPQPPAAIDANRFDLQDEYVEWLTERNGDQVERVTFTTDFPEYYEALASVSAAALIAGVQDAIPGATPIPEELFGPGFNPETASPRERATQFRQFFRNNPWNNGEKGILCLAHPNSTVSALFLLVEPCAVPRQDLPAGAVCGQVACVPGRNSDPAICQGAQNLARRPNVLSLQDPVGIKMLELLGQWQLDGTPLEINNPDRNQGIWTISRNGRRATLNVVPGLTLGGVAITTGAQVAAQLRVGADVITAAESLVPEWAQTGNESTRLLNQI